MTDYSLPVNSTLVSNVLGILRDRDSSIAKMDFTGDTNLASGFLRYNRTNRVFEEWSGSAWVEQRVEPAGIVKPFGGTTAPRGHLLCNGAAVSRTTYAALFTVIGTSYGAGDGSTTFNLPNLQGRFPLGLATSGTGSSLGQTGGAIDHSHNVGAHYHGKGTIAISTDSGIHTTTLSLNHGHTASSADAPTGIRPKDGADNDVSGYVNITISDPGHFHGIPGHGTTTSGDGKNTGNAVNKFAKSRQTATSGTGDTDGQTYGGGGNVTISNGNHRHSVTLNDPQHKHTITVVDYAGSSSDSATSTRGQHQHSNSAFSGSVGATGSTNDGDAGFSSGTANPPFQVLNYIISF